MTIPTSTSEHSPGKKTARRVGAPSGPRNADLRRAFLVETAGRLFLEKGYEATTMDEIAAGAGVAKGTLYHYFASKSELLQILRDNFNDEIMSRVKSRVEKCAADDWWARLKAWIEAASAAYFELCALHDVLFFGAEMPHRFVMADVDVIKYLAKLLSAGSRAGAWRADDEQWTALIMFYGFRGGCDEAIAGGRCTEEVSEKLYGLFMRMLADKKATPVLGEEAVQKQD